MLAAPRKNFGAKLSASATLYYRDGTACLPPKRPRPSRNVSAFRELFECSCGGETRASVFSVAARRGWNSITSYPWWKAAVAPHEMFSSCVSDVTGRKAEVSEYQRLVSAIVVPDSVPTPCMEALLNITSAHRSGAPNALQTRNIAQSWLTSAPTAKSLIYRGFLPGKRRASRLAAPDFGNVGPARGERRRLLASFSGPNRGLRIPAHFTVGSIGLPRCPTWC